MHGFEFGVGDGGADGNANGEALDGNIEAENINNDVAAITVDDVVLVRLSCRFQFRFSLL